MRNRILIYSIALLMSALFFSCGKSKNEVANEKPDVDIEEGYHSRNDSVFVSNVWMYFIDEPAYHLARARKSLVAGDINSATYEIERAATFIQLEETNAKALSKETLMSVRKELEKLSDDLDAGKQVTIKNIDKIFSKDLYVLARHFQLESVKYSNSLNTLQTGSALKAAVLDLNKANSWIENKLTAKDSGILKEIEDLAEKMITGENFSADAVGKSIDNLSMEIEKFARINELPITPES